MPFLLISGCSIYWAFVASVSPRRPEPEKPFPFQEAGITENNAVGRTGDTESCVQLSGVAPDGDGRVQRALIDGTSSQRGQEGKGPAAHRPEMDWGWSGRWPTQWEWTAPPAKDDGVQGEEACQPVVAGHGRCQLSQDTLILLLRICFPFAGFTICSHFLWPSLPNAWASQHGHAVGSLPLASCVLHFHIPCPSEMCRLLCQVFYFFPVPPVPLPYEASAVYLIPIFEMEKGAQKICFSSPFTALCPLSFVI